MKKASHSKSTKRQAALAVATRVLRLRIKDKHAKHFLEQSREVNQVWNYSQDLALKVFEREHRFMSAYDMATYTKGAAKEGLSLHSQTVQAVSEEYCTRRKQFKKAKLRWRVSHGSLRSLSWIPVKAVALSYRAGPKGLAGLGVRQWTCSVCQSEHDRDTNAAKNILARGMLELEREFSIAGEAQTLGFAKADEAAVNKDGQPSQVGHDLPVAGIIAHLGR